MFHSVTQAIGQARLADLHREAQRDALAQAARRARRAHRHESRSVSRRVPSWLGTPRRPVLSALRSSGSR
jgi:hypothetical protein